MNSFYRKILLIATLNVIPLWGQSEFLIDSTFIGGVAADNQRFPSVAFDGVNYLVVWADMRSSQHSDIFGTRIAPDGTILDSCGIVITTAPRDQMSPSVAFDGVNYFVVWTDYRNFTAEIFGARISQEGHVLDSAGIAISTSAWDREPCVAYDGENYFVVWKRYGSVAGKRVSRSGVVLDSPITITTTSTYEGAPAVVYGSTNYFVVWQDERNDSTADSTDIYGARVSPLGIVLDTTGVAISNELNHQLNPSVAYDGKNFFAVWEDFGGEIYGARVNQAAVLLDTAGIQIARFGSIHPAVTYGFGKYFVAWQYSDHLVGARIDTSGVVMDTSSILIARGMSGYELGYPSVIDGSANYYIAWHKEDAAYFDIYGTEVTQAGQVVHTGGVLLSTSVANTQWNSAVAFDGTNYLTVWTDDRFNHYGFGKIYGRRVSASGVLDSVIPISVGSIYNSKDYPAVAFGGKNYLVAWQVYRRVASRYQWEIYGALVTPDGVVLSPEIAIAPSFAAYNMYPAVAFDGTNYLVVWERNSGYGNVQAARVNQSGTVLDTVPIAIATNYYSEMSPAVAFDGTNYLVVWEDERDWASSDIYGTRISQSGEILDPGGFRISKADVCRDPAIVFDGNDYFVVWESDDLGDIYGARVSTSGTVIDSVDMLILHTTYYDYCPKVVFDGENYVIIWEYQDLFTYSAIVGAKLDTSYAIIDSFTVSEQPGDQVSPSMAHGRSKLTFIGYTGWTDSIKAFPVSTMRIWGKFYPFVGVEEDRGSTSHITCYSLTVNPNPFRRRTDIRLKSAIADIDDVMLAVYDVSGRLVRSFSSALHHAHSMMQIVWDGTDDHGQQLSSGVYFLRFESGDYKDTEKLILLR